ncbi:MAG: transposase [Chloroflexota bacterium]|nr:transposase [Chloroflexota bacterium]
MSPTAKRGGIPIDPSASRRPRERQGEHLDEWLTAVDRCEVDALRRFGAGLTRDLDAVRAGLTDPWSNGQTEGQVHRLKLLKRQMYVRTAPQPRRSHGRTPSLEVSVTIWCTKPEHGSRG